ncbi:MAG: hypothetical protein V1874_14390 [Spirochaetota bacterium]
MIYRIILLILLPTYTLFAGQLGVNINLAERGGTFVDIVKENYRWIKAVTGSQLTPAEVDKHGWPKTDAQFIADYRPVAEWSGSIDDPSAYRIDISGTYKCSFIGNASVRGVSGGTVRNKTYDAVSNLTTFDFVVASPSGSNYGLIVIEFTKTKRTASGTSGSGFTSFRMLRPGYKSSSTKTFTDEFITALTGIKFSAIRFMNFTIVNGCDPNYPQQTKWSKRKQKDDASQNRIPPIGKTDGASWDYVIELCNIVRIDPWINIPVSADSGYIRETAKLFRANLNRNLNIYIESSNEVWNTAPGFEQSHYNKAQAKTLGIGEHENHARRTIEIASIFAQVFGKNALNKRIRIVLCSHSPMLKWWMMPMLNYISKTYGKPKDFIYAIACQSYFGGGVTAEDSVDKILANCKTNITDQIDETGKINEAGRKQWIKFAHDMGFIGGFCSYEGGPDHGGGGVINIANRIKAERDPGMAGIWTSNFDDAFFKIGGNLVMQYTLCSAYTRYGCWGLTDDISKPYRNSKYKAAKLLAEKCSAKISPAIKKSK